MCPNGEGALIALQSAINASLGSCPDGAKGTAIIEQPSFFSVGKLGFERSAFIFCF